MLSVPSLTVYPPELMNSLLKTRLSEVLVLWSGQERMFKVDKEEGRLGRPRRRWEDNIKMDLQEVGCRGMDWIELAQDRDRWRTRVNALTKIRVP